MEKRLQLQAILEGILESSNVYFQPPASVRMSYPCIVYERDQARSSFADNGPYRYTQRYQVTVMDKDPDSAIPQKIAHLSMCVFNRHFTSDNLHHDVFSLYF